MTKGIVRTPERGERVIMTQNIEALELAEARALAESMFPQCFSCGHWIGRREGGTVCWCPESVFVSDGSDADAVYGAWIPAPEYKKTLATARFLARRAMEVHEDRHDLIVDELSAALMPYLFPDWDERCGRHPAGTGRVINNGAVLTTAHRIGGPLHCALSKGHTPLL